MVFAPPGREPVRLAASYGGIHGDPRIREVFCLAFKSGTDMQDTLHQGCIALSVAMRHGATIEELAHAMAEDSPRRQPRSILGLIVREGARLQPDILFEDDERVKNLHQGAAT
jgi:hypothetical protein